MFNQPVLVHPVMRNLMQTNRAIVGISIAALIGALSVVAVNRAHVDIDSQAIADAFATQFPQERCVASACIRLTDPRIDLSLGAGRVAFSTSMDANFLAHHVYERIVLKGVPRYDRNSGNFYLDDAGLSTASGGDLSLLATTAGRFAERVMANVPLFNVEQVSSAAGWGKRFINNAFVQDGKLRLTFAF